MPVVLRLLSRLRRRVLIHRRGLAALCCAVATWCVLTTVRPPLPDQVLVWVAAHDLPGGTVIAPGDLARVALPPDVAPPDALRRRDALLGRTTSGPVGRGEVLAPTRLLGPGHLDGYPGRVAVGLRIPDTEVADLLRAGDRVDLVGSDPQSARGPIDLVRDAVVLSVPRARGDPQAPTTTGRLVVFAVPEASAAEVAAGGSALFLTVIWSR